MARQPSVSEAHWWAIVRHNGGYALDVYPDEEERYRRFLQGEDEFIIGEFKTADEAHECVCQWLNKQ